MDDTGRLTPGTHTGEPRSGLDFRVRRRDRYSIELKFRHLVDPSQTPPARRRTTRIRIAFFLPYSFNIRPGTLDPEQFYDDVKLYIRFNTPTITVEELLDPESHDSPLARMRRILESDERIEVERLKYEAKLLGTVVKSILRDALVARIVGEHEPGQDAVDGFCATVERLVDGFSAFRLALDDDRLGEESRRHLRLVDEHLSLTIENYLVRLMTHDRLAGSDLSLEPIREAILREHRYRRARGYPSVVDAGDGTGKREEYIYRYKVLKHYASSVLFFEIHRGNQARRVEHLLYAIAAGIAMAVATGIAFIGQIRFGTLSSALFLVLVGSYMLKDRIKDAFRSVFQRTLGRLFYDRRTVFRDQTTRRKMGLVKERTSFIPQSRVGADLLRARARGGFESAIMHTTPERVLEYTKLLRIFERRLHRTHRRITGLADINIVDLKNLLRYLVRQREAVPVTDGDSLRLEDTRRIYHLNMLISADTGEGNRWHKVRLVVDAGGIRRIERPAGP